MCDNEQVHLQSIFAGGFNSFKSRLICPSSVSCSSGCSLFCLANCCHSFEKLEYSCVSRHFIRVYFASFPCLFLQRIAPCQFLCWMAHCLFLWRIGPSLFLWREPPCLFLLRTSPCQFHLAGFVQDGTLLISVEGTLVLSVTPLVILLLYKNTRNKNLRIYSNVFDLSFFLWIQWGTYSQDASCTFTFSRHARKVFLEACISSDMQWIEFHPSEDWFNFRTAQAAFVFWLGLFVKQLSISAWYNFRCCLPFLSSRSLPCTLWQLLNSQWLLFFLQ